VKKPKHDSNKRDGWALNGGMKKKNRKKRGKRGDNYQKLNGDESPGRTTIQLKNEGPFKNSSKI